ncbi:succinate dehydrogenase, cytochrome b556 subunit [Deinococcus fonticola]|uniref:succinate dehydrogenase, cytochrome b556 subunit n=1 Tax=Deinococcus fonticola TaxID=2528713 RepID=UPI00107537B0|nr:succinate dehydrogenase, cytochrome b556 subunit [Deinococcus fonticola]
MFNWKYKGSGQWPFILHRASGLAILLYLMLHIFSIGSIIFGEKFYMDIHHVYGLPIFRLGLIGLATLVAFHAFNGLRIILMDFTSFGVRVQKQTFMAVIVLTLAFLAFSLYMNIPRILGGY